LYRKIAEFMPPATLAFAMSGSVRSPAIHQYEHTLVEVLPHTVVINVLVGSQLRGNMHAFQYPRALNMTTGTYHERVPLS